MKIHQIPQVIFQTTSQFFFNVVSLFSVMRGNSSVHFLVETLYDLLKRNPSKYKISDFRLVLLLKVYKILAKKVHRRVMQNLKKTDLLFQKLQEFGEF